jgi:hypothetical protein
MSNRSRASDFKPMPWPFRHRLQLGVPGKITHGAVAIDLIPNRYPTQVPAYIAPKLVI